MNDVLASGRVLGGRYRLVEELARGGMARVWAAEDPVLRRRVAVKILDPTLGDDDHVRQRFRHEAIAAARLAHPGIVATYDTGEDDGIAYIVMELVAGPTLRRILDERGRLEVAEVADIGAQVADALAHAHSRGLVHRDVKPGNVLVEPDGRVKVTDFGIAKAAGTSELTRAGAVVGTARYLAPEQVEGAAVDERADVYALGLVLYEMLCGQTPFEGDNEIANAVARLRAVPVPVGLSRPDVPKAVQDVVARSLERDPDDRLATAAELREVLTPFRRDAVLDLTMTSALHTSDRTTEQSVPSPAMTSTSTPSFTSTPGGPPHQHHRAARAIVLSLLVAVGVLVLLVAFAGRGDQTGRTTSPPSVTASTPVRTKVPIRLAQDFDPFGDNRESHAQVANLYDGHRDTSWSTEQYFSVGFGGKKPGVGVWFQLTSPTAVRQVKVHAGSPGWSAEVYVSTSPPTRSDLGTRVGGGENLPAEATLPIASPRQGRYVLLWLTQLPERAGRWSLYISEVELAR